MITQVLKSFFSASEGGCQRLFLFLWYKGCVIQESYCCEVGIGQQAQAQWNTLAFRVLTQGARNRGEEHIPPVLANHSLEEKAFDF